MWMEFKMKSAIVAEMPLGSQHFFLIVCGWPAGLFDAENFGKLFFEFFLTVLARSPANISEVRNSGRMECRALSMRSEGNNPCY